MNKPILPAIRDFIYGFCHEYPVASFIVACLICALVWLVIEGYNAIEEPKD